MQTFEGFTDIGHFLMSKRLQAGFDPRGLRKCPADPARERINSAGDF